MRAAPKTINLPVRVVQAGPDPVPVAPDKAVERRPHPVAAVRDKAVEVEPHPVVVRAKAVEGGINSAVGTIHPQIL